jgi:Rad3-related DNA helicase
MRPKKNIFIVDEVHLNEDAMIKYAAQVRMTVKCDDFRV